MPKEQPLKPEDQTSDPTIPGGRLPDAAARAPLPKPLAELVQLLAHALAKRWLQEHKRTDPDRDSNPTDSS